MKIAQGNGGWFVVEGDHGFPGPLYIRLSEIDGRPRVTELYVDGRGDPVQPGALRRLPLAFVEETAAGMLDDATGRLSTPGPDLSRLASYLGTSWGPGAYAGRHCESCDAPLRGTKGRSEALGSEAALVDWVALGWLAQFPDSGIPQVPVQKSRAEEWPTPEVTLSAPENGLTDEFLSDVARAYRAAVEQRRPPATALAQAAGVERRTVESWIYKARKRGLMPPAAKRGRVV